MSSCRAGLSSRVARTCFWWSFGAGTWGPYRIAHCSRISSRRIPIIQIRAGFFHLVSKRCPIFSCRSACRRRRIMPFSVFSSGKSLLLIILPSVFCRADFFIWRFAGRDCTFLFSIERNRMRIHRNQHRPGWLWWRRFLRPGTRRWGWGSQRNCWERIWTFWFPIYLGADCCRSVVCTWQALPRCSYSSFPVLSTRFSRSQWPFDCFHACVCTSLSLKTRGLSNSRRARRLWMNSAISAFVIFSNLLYQVGRCSCGGR